MGGALIRLLIGCAITLGIGWMVAKPPSDPVAGVVSHASVPSFEREGLQLAIAVGDFTALGLNVQPSAPDTAPAGPPPPDVADLFRHALTAIVRSDAGTVVWVVDSTTPMGRRPLRRGSVFQDGWVLAAVHDQEIVLRKSGEERRVSIVGTAPEAPAAPPAAGVRRRGEPASAPPPR